jgi:hypothetical protein
MLPRPLSDRSLLLDRVPALLSRLCNLLSGGYADLLLRSFVLSGRFPGLLRNHLLPGRYGLSQPGDRCVRCRRERCATGQRERPPGQRDAVDRPQRGSQARPPATRSPTVEPARDAAPEPGSLTRTDLKGKTRARYPLAVQAGDIARCASSRTNCRSRNQAAEHLLIVSSASPLTAPMALSATVRRRSGLPAPRGLLVRGGRAGAGPGVGVPGFSRPGRVTTAINRGMPTLTAYVPVWVIASGDDLGSQSRSRPTDPCFTTK